MVHERREFASPIVRELQLKTTMSAHRLPGRIYYERRREITSVGGCSENWIPSTVRRNAKPRSHCGNLYGGASKKPNNPRTIKAWNYHMTQKPQHFRGYIKN